MSSNLYKYAEQVYDMLEIALDGGVHYHDLLCRLYKCQQKSRLRQEQRMNFDLAEDKIDRKVPLN
jgi:hypothetical protein